MLETVSNFQSTWIPKEKPRANANSEHPVLYQAVYQQGREDLVKDLDVLVKGIYEKNMGKCAAMAINLHKFYGDKIKDVRLKVDYPKDFQIIVILKQGEYDLHAHDVMNKIIELEDEYQESDFSIHTSLIEDNEHLSPDAMLDDGFNFIWNGGKED